MNLYNDIATLLAEIRAGEDSLLEFKEVVWKGNEPRFAREDGSGAKLIAEVFASMANTEGGVVVFGVNRSGEAVGIPQEKKELLEQWVILVARDHTEPPLHPTLDWVYLPRPDGAEALCLKVGIGRDVHNVVRTRDGRYLRRVGSHRQTIPTEQLSRMLARRNLLLPFEEQPLLSANIEVLDVELVERYHLARFGQTLSERGLSHERFLVAMKCAARDDGGELHPTHLGALLFAPELQSLLPGAYVDLAVYAGKEADGNTVDARRIGGTLVSQAESVLTYLRSSAALAVVSRKTGGGRSDRPAYAEVAVQEALINALVHRDYSLSGSQVRLYVFPDRLEFWSPGPLHNTLTVEDLYLGCQPMRRNQHLAGFLRDFESPWTGLKYMEARGEGFRTLVRESETLSGRRPLLEVRGQAILLTIYAAQLDAPGLVT